MNATTIALAAGLLAAPPAVAPRSDPVPLFCCAVTFGPTMAVRSVAEARFERGWEVALWSQINHHLLVGVDGGISSRARYLEAQLGLPLVDGHVLLGGSAGAAWSECDERADPQATLWSVISIGGARHARLPLPVLPYVRLTGLGADRRVWQAGLMLKAALPIPIYPYSLFGRGRAG